MTDLLNMIGVLGPGTISHFGNSNSSGILPRGQRRKYKAEEISEGRRREADQLHCESLPYERFNWSVLIIYKATVICIHVVRSHNSRILVVSYT